MPRQRSSFIWEYFTKTESGAAVCDTCHRRIVVNGGSTSNLIKHLKCKHKDLVQDAASLNDNDMNLKEEYILLQSEPSESYEDFIQEENSKEELNDHQYEEMAPPKAKKSKHVHSEDDYRMRPMFLSDMVRRSPIKNNSRVVKEREDCPLEIFAKYMVSLMKDMPRKICEQTQLKIVSVILEAKREENEREQTSNSEKMDKH